MLTFLQKIKKPSSERSSAKRYVLYAIGEIALVAIGILLALQIDNWNEERKEKAPGLNYLVRLQADLTSDNLFLSDHIQRVRKLQEGFRSFALKRHQFQQTEKVI